MARIIDLDALTEDDWTRAHLAIEDFLVEMRDSRTGILGPANGFVIRERDGSPSAIIRLGTRDGIKMAVEALAKGAQS